MSIKVSTKISKSVLTKSKLPDADYVINPYVGCSHGCIYCYAEFMKKFSGHDEPWGSFLDIKQYDSVMDFSDVNPDKTILIGSVTDAYNPFEATCCVTQSVVSALSNCKARVEILTKSNLILRDLQLLKQIPNLSVGISMNTCDDSFRKKIEPYAAPVKNRIETLKQLHDEGISTYLFMAPIFPEITDYKELLDTVEDYVDYVCFENLNLRGTYRNNVLSFIEHEYPELSKLYKDIYVSKSDRSYWMNSEREIEEYCKINHIKFNMYFHHGN